jgi:superfamily II DNA or RNA helicase
MQLATGAGKTHIFSEMAKSAQKRGRKIWIMVPRKELLNQASDNLRDNEVIHGMIAPGFVESKAYTVHVVSKDTLIRRYDKIKTHPEFIIIDEAHIALDRYLEIAGKFPDSKILGVTATPERLDGRGLSELYETLVEGPSIAELISCDYLTDVRYFCPPIQGITKLHRRGTDYNADELAALLERRKVYGSAIEHYRRHADKKPCLIYCRSVQAAAETAQKFSESGYLFENIDGTMSNKRRRTLIDALKTGKIHGLTSCELITYGLDVPRVECVIMLRPTLSRALFCQMIGRGLRPYQDKYECVVLDHVGNLQEHGHPLEAYNWKFDGKEKRGATGEKAPAALKLCPEIDFMYCEKLSCRGCPHHSGKFRDPRIEYVNTQLVEAGQYISFSDRPMEHQREYVDRINEVVDRYKKNEPNIESIAVSEMMQICKELGRQPLWIYNRLNKNKHLVNITLLHEIARQAGYKPGWVYFQKKRLERKR